MKIQQVESLLNIASMANRWPKLAHLRDAALRELEQADLNTVEQILPVMIVSNGKSADDDRT